MDVEWNLGRKWDSKYRVLIEKFGISILVVNQSNGRNQFTNGRMINGKNHLILESSENENDYWLLGVEHSYV